MKISKLDFNDSIDKFYDYLIDTTPNVINSYQKADCIFLKLSINQVTIDISIAYHEVYQSPIFYFRVFDPSPVISLASLNLIALLNDVQLSLDFHHILQEPWWLVHPCETRDYMDQFEIDSTIDYLTSWWSIYGLKAIFQEINAL